MLLLDTADSIIPLRFRVFRACSLLWSCVAGGGILRDIFRALEHTNVISNSVTLRFNDLLSMNRAELNSLSAKVCKGLKMKPVAGLSTYLQNWRRTDLRIKALLRWKMKRHWNISPEVFIPLWKGKVAGGRDFIANHAIREFIQLYSEWNILA